VDVNNLFLMWGFCLNLFQLKATCKLWLVFGIELEKPHIGNCYLFWFSSAGVKISTK